MIVRCSRCKKPTANHGQVCWWCLEGKERPDWTKVDAVHLSHGCASEMRSWNRKAEPEEFDPHREARIQAHIERIWGPPLVAVQESGPEAALASGPLQETEMANEITLSGSLSYEDSNGVSADLAITELLATVATKKKIAHSQSIGFAAEEAIVLGEVTSPGWAIFVNRDSTNFIKLLTGTAGVIFAKLLPGEFALLRLGSGAQAPYAQSDTAACILDYVLILT